VYRAALIDARHPVSCLATDLRMKTPLAHSDHSECQTPSNEQTDSVVLFMSVCKCPCQGTLFTLFSYINISELTSDDYDETLRFGQFDDTTTIS